MKEVKHAAAGFGAIGLVAAFVFTVVWVVAACGDPSWTLGDDYISAMGVSSVDLTKNVFNYGCMLVGLLAIVYGCGKAYRLCGADRASGILAAFAGLMLILIGIIHSGEDLHTPISVIMFILFAFAILAAGFADGKAGRTLNAALCACVLAAAIISFACLSHEMAEAVAIAGILAWIYTDSIKLILG